MQSLLLRYEKDMIEEKGALANKVGRGRSDHPYIKGSDKEALFQKGWDRFERYRRAISAVTDADVATP